MPEDNINPASIPVELNIEAKVEPKKPKKKSSILIIILLAVLALGGIGFGVYGMFFYNSADSIPDNCLNGENPKETESDFPKVHVNNGATGGTKSYAISIVDNNTFRITEYVSSSAVDGKTEMVGDETYKIKGMGADGLANIIRLMSKKGESSYFSSSANVSFLLHMLESLSDEQIEQVIDYVASIEGN